MGAVNGNLMGVYAVVHDGLTMFDDNSFLPFSSHAGYS